jgi:hypothetical protein
MLVDAKCRAMPKERGVPPIRAWRPGVPTSFFQIVFSSPYQHETKLKKRGEGHLERTDSA